VKHKHSRRNTEESIAELAELQNANVSESPADELKNLHRASYESMGKTYSEEEVLELMKSFIIQKSIDYPEFTEEELKKGAMKAFKNGLTALALIHGMHYIGGQDMKENLSPKVEQQMSAEKPIPSSYNTEGNSYRNSQIKNFMNAISMNNENKSYGLNPASVKEMAGAMGKQNPAYRGYSEMSDEEIQNSFAENPDHEKQIATHLASHLYDKHGGNESDMAHAWSSGTGNPKENNFVQQYHQNRKELEKNPKIMQQFVDNPEN
jgi:hypothetical protein